MNDELLNPPGLPDPVQDVRRDDAPRTTWDALAVAIIGDSSVQWDRCRVRWLRWTLFRWHCGRPMRLAVIEHQDKHVAFGWRRYWRKQLACGRCGYFRDTF